MELSGQFHAPAASKMCSVTNYYEIMNECYFIEIGILICFVTIRHLTYFCDVSEAASLSETLVTLRHKPENHGLNLMNFRV
jgi:hypothetical protein